LRQARPGLSGASASIAELAADIEAGFGTKGFATYYRDDYIGFRLARTLNP
jgi:hypothetical protein